MKKILMTGMAGLMAFSLTGEVAFAKKGIRETLSLKSIKERIVKRVRGDVLENGISTPLNAKEQLKAAEALANELTNNHRIGIPRENLSKLLILAETNANFMKMTSNEKTSTTLLESVELAVALKDVEVQRQLREKSELKETEVKELSETADTVLHLVAALAEVPAAQLQPAIISKNIELQALIRQISQIEPLLTEYTSAERISWNRQLQSFKDNLSRGDVLDAYKESVRDIVAKEKNIAREKVTEDMLKEKLDEIRQCKA